MHITLILYSRLLKKFTTLALNINTFVINLKNVFPKAPQSVDIHKEIMPIVLKLLAEYILTSWFEVANFCINNFDKLKILHNKLDNKTVGLQNCIHIPSSRSVKSYSVSFFVSN